MPGCPAAANAPRIRVRAAPSWICCSLTILESGKVARCRTPTSLAVAVVLEHGRPFVIEQRADAHFRRPSSVVCFIEDCRPFWIAAETLPPVPCLANFLAKRSLPSRRGCAPGRSSAAGSCLDLDSGKRHDAPFSLSSPTASLGMRSGEPLGRRCTGNQGMIWGNSGTVLLQHFDVVPQQVGMGIEQRVA